MGVNAENDHNPETNSDTTQHINDQSRSDAAHAEEDAAKKLVKRTKSMVEIFEWMEKSKFKPQKPQQPLLQEEYYLGFGKPDTPLNVKLTE